MIKYNGFVLPKVVRYERGHKKLDNIRANELCSYYLEFLSHIGEYVLTPLCSVQICRCIPSCDDCICSIRNTDILDKFLQNVNFGDKSYK